MKIILKNGKETGEVLNIQKVEGCDIYALFVVYRDSATGLIETVLEGYKSLSERILREKELRQIERTSAC